MPFPQTKSLGVQHPMPQVPEAQPPDEHWQTQARHLVDCAESVLWSPEGDLAMHYLKQRGLTEETILRARLGCVPGQPTDWLQIGNLNVPCGILLPLFVGKEMWAVKARRASGYPKYTQIAGGSAHGFEDSASATTEGAAKRILQLLYVGMELPQRPLTDFTPAKEDRNRELYWRYLKGERAVDLAVEYGISLQRVYVIIRIGKRNDW